MTGDRSRRPILVYRLGSLGDMCVAIPALKAVRARWPASRIVLLTNLSVENRAASAQSILEGTGLVDGYLAYPVGARHPGVLLRLAAEIRRGGYACVVNLAAWRGLAASWRDRAFFLLAGIGRTHGYGREETGPLRRKAAEGGGAGGEVESEAERIFRRVRALSGAAHPDRRAHRLDFTAGEVDHAEAVLSAAGVSKGFLALSIGGKGSAKDWTQPNWTALMRRLSTRYPGRGLVIVGAAQERARGDELLSVWEGPSLNLSGSCNPRESGAVLSLASAYVGHDSGPTHLAAAAGVRCAGIYAARHPRGQWFPQGDGHAILYHQTECAGCNLDECVVERKRCILSITVDEAEAAVRSILEERA